MSFKKTACNLIETIFFIHHQVMMRALKIIESLKLVTLVCVFDQAIYSKAIEIQWKDQEKFGSIVLMMGMFHMLMMYMHILSKRFSDAGMSAILIQSGAIAEGSVEKALCGKMYNRGVRAYKMMYEAIVRKVLEEIGVNDDGDIVDFDMNTTFDDVWEENESLAAKYNKFVDYRFNIMEKGQPLQIFWMSFLEMVELLLNTLYALRSGDWLLLIECIKLILPYTFAYDHVNYARYLSAMLGDMLQLPKRFPNVYNEFLSGRFVAQLTDGSKFSRVETDKVIEMTLNKDTKTPCN